MRGKARNLNVNILERRRTKGRRLLSAGKYLIATLTTPHLLNSIYFSKNKAKSFSFHQCRRNFLPLSHLSFRGASSFCFNEQIWVANLAFTTWRWICHNLCVHLFPPECKVFHWISRTCLITLCLLVFSHIFVFAKIAIASAAAAVCCIIIAPLCETTIAQTRGGGSQYLCCLSKTQFRVKSTTGKSLCYNSPLFIVVKNISVWGPFLRFTLLLKSFSKCT